MHKPPHQMLVIFGASGDLTRRKLIPAPFDLHRQNLLPGNFVILGPGRTEHTDESFRNLFRESLEEKHPETATSFLQRLFYHPAGSVYTHCMPADRAGTEPGKRTGRLHTDDH
ncbi:MAG TPA: hypothetical protein ENF21_07135 [Bacteroidetes bacterium]|nr:hypothetical protein [Bacteroidota bacterium]